MADDAQIRAEADAVRRHWDLPDVRPSMVLFVDDVERLLDAARAPRSEEPFDAAKHIEGKVAEWRAAPPTEETP